MSAHSKTQPRIRVAVVLVQGGDRHPDGGNDPDRVLLVQHRKGDSTYWLLPGGGLDYGETLYAAGAREVLEETGLTVTIERVLYISEAIAPDRSRHILNFTLLGRVEGGDLHRPADDVIEKLEWVPFSDLAGLDLRPAIANQLTQSHTAGFQHEPQFLGLIWT